MLLVLEVELEGGLGDVQAGVDGREFFSHNLRSVRAHSCTCEHAGFAAAQSTVRVTDIRHEWLRLPDERARAVPEGNERTRAAAVPPAGGTAAPSSCLAGSQTRKMKMQHTRGPGRGAAMISPLPNLSPHSFVVGRGNQTPFPATTFLETL
jgi:hypothetical protein